MRTPSPGVSGAADPGRGDATARGDRPGLDGGGEPGVRGDAGPRLGATLRAVRRERGVSQAELARRLGISASYLNLIEHDQRRVPAHVLVRVSSELDVPLQRFSADADEQLRVDLFEALSDPMFDELGITSHDVQELVQVAPNLGRAMLTLHRGYRSTRESADELAHRIYDAQEIPGARAVSLPSEAVIELLQRHRNYFHELELAAEALWEGARLRHDDLHRGLVEQLERIHGVRVRIERSPHPASPLRQFDGDARTLTLSEALSPSSRRFHIAAQLGLLAHERAIAGILDEAGLSSGEAQALGRRALAQYFAGAVVMPYERFLGAAVRERYDLEVLMQRFDVSFEQVCHRLTTLQRPRAEGIAFHMIRVDLAGNISKRFSASGIRFARFSGGCARWNVFSAFLTPGMIRVQPSVMPDGERYFCIARTVPKLRGGYHTPHAIQAIGLGCRMADARALVYSDGVDCSPSGSATPIGVTCRLCERDDCEQRAFPSLRAAAPTGTAAVEPGAAKPAPGRRRLPTRA